MNIKYVQRLQTIDHLVRIRGTGTPEQLAKKLGLSKSKVYVYMDVLKQLGASVRYCRSRKSYYYEDHGGFNFRFNATLTQLEK